MPFSSIGGYNIVLGDKICITIINCLHSPQEKTRTYYKSATGNKYVPRVHKDTRAARILNLAIVSKKPRAKQFKET